MSHIRLRLHASIRIHGALPHTPPKETFCKKSPLESRKTAFDFYYLSGFYLLNPKLSKDRRTCLIFAFGCTQVSGYMGLLPHTPPKETFCKKSPLESRKTAFDFYYLSGFYLLNPKLSKDRRTCLIFAFGCTQVSGYMGLLPHTPPKETFCKKSPLESRKTIFDFYVWFFIVCSQGIKITIHAADF